MELLEFLRQISQQRINVRDKVSVSTLGLNIVGTLVPCTVVVTRDGQPLSNILHERDGNLLISVKTIPDGIGPDVGNPILIQDINSINKEA